MLPPYSSGTRSACAVAAASCARNTACTACACSGVAVLPVPIAQTGSYATTNSLTHGTHMVNHCSELALDHLLGLTSFTLLQGFTHTDDGRDALSQRSLRLGGNHCIRLTVVLATLRVTHERVTHPKSCSMDADTSPV